MDRFEFDDIDLDVATNQLSRAGVRLEISPRALEALTYLVSQRDRTVVTDELLREVWGVETLSQSAVPTCIASIRRVLGDDAANPRFIETVRGRGYRFVGAVRHIPPWQAGTGVVQPLVGRAAEVALLTRELQFAVAGTSRLVAVFGPAGIGKTSISEDLVSRARERRVAGISINTPETGGAPAMWPWVQVVKALDRIRPGLPDHDELLSEFIAPAAAPHRAPDDAFDGPAKRAEERFNLFDTVADRIGTAVADQPLVLVLDDFHRADAASFELLRHVHRTLAQSPLLIVPVLRYEMIESAPEEGPKLSSLPRSTEIHLQAWTRLESAQYVASRAAVRLGKKAVDTLHERSGGNPFLMSRLVDSIRSRDPNETYDERHRPLQDVVWDLIGHLLPTQRSILTHAAVIGREFAVDVLAIASSVPPEDVHAEIDRCCARGIVEAVSNSPGKFRFVHVLVRDALYDEIGVAKRARMHLMAGSALEQARASDLRAHSAALADHFARAAHIGGGEQAVNYARQAAEEARTRLALESAPSFHRVALAAADYCPEINAARRCEMEIELGEAEMRASERDSGRDTLASAARQGKQLGDVRLMARAALGFAPGALALEVGIFDPALIALLEEALAATTDADSELRAIILARLSLALMWGDRESEQRATAQEAVCLARAAGIPGPLAMALMAEYCVSGGPENLATRTQLTEELGVAAKLAATPDLVLSHRLLHVTNLLESGHWARLDSEINRYRSEVDESRIPHFLWYTGLFRAMRQLHRGKFDAAAVSAEQFVQVGSRIADKNASLSFGAHSAYQLWERGSPTKAVAIATPITQHYPSIDAWHSALAVFGFDAGDLEIARPRMARQLERAREVPRNPVWITNAAFLAEACSRIGDTAHARRLYDELLPGTQQYAVIGYGTLSLGPISRHLGLLAATFGDSQTAIRHFESAIAQEIAADGVPWLAKAKLDLARTLLARAEPGDHDRSVNLADEVTALTEHHGMITVNDQARAFADRARASR